jgi:hypothetical protein
VESLASALGDRDEWVRLYAARTLAELGGAAIPALPALRTAVGDAFYNVRRAAVFALATSGDHSPATIDAFAAALGDEQLGGLAAEALARCGPAGLPALLSALRGPADRRAAFAAYGLSVVGAPEARAAATSWAASGRLPFAPTPGLFYCRRPVVEMDDVRAAEFGRILADAQARGGTVPIAYRSRYPKYEFLHYLAHRRGLVLHGSNRRDLDVLEPRWALAQGEEADLDAIYTAKDPFTCIFFGIVDRSRVTGIRHNSFAGQRLDGGSEVVHEYALNADAVREGHFVPGMVYALPEGEFEYLPRSGTWVGRRPVAPVARVPVEPADFPLLHQILGFEQIHSIRAPIRVDDHPFLADARMYLVRPEPRPV